MLFYEFVENKQFNFQNSKVADCIIKDAVIKIESDLNSNDLI